MASPSKRPTLSASAAAAAAASEADSLRTSIYHSLCDKVLTRDQWLTVLKTPIAAGTGVIVIGAQNFF
jgi:hypothetical protein